MNKIVGTVSKISVGQWAPFALRLIVGYGFMAHGYAKLSRGPDAFASILSALHVPAPYVMAWVTVRVGICRAVGPGV